LLIVFLSYECESLRLVAAFGQAALVLRRVSQGDTAPPPLLGRPADVSDAPTTLQQQAKMDELKALITGVAGGLREHLITTRSRAANLTESTAIVELAKHVSLLSKTIASFDDLYV
jgi:hypothetical protein